MKSLKHEIIKIGGLFFCCLIFLFSSGTVLAAPAPDIQIEIGGLKLEDSPPCEPGKPCPIDWIGQYVAALYRYGVGLAAGLSVIMIMAGGFLWLSSGGSPDRVNKAKDFIISALAGLMLAMFSFIILYTVNPRLTSLDTVNINSPSAPVAGADGERPDGGISENELVNKFFNNSGLADPMVRNYNLIESGDTYDRFTFEVEPTPEVSRFLVSQAELRMDDSKPYYAYSYTQNSIRYISVWNQGLSEIDNEEVWRVEVITQE
ncbi:hypothetical protein HYZ76_01790 [Candidatus Falkowbacteria bacterium]|nr:hypothetical protein [Candidatus Falkowbacteria bacterium]